MHNPVRGEVEITLGRARYVLVPSYRAIAHTERLAGAGLVRIAERLGAGDVRYGDVAALIAGGAGEEVLSLEDAGALLIEHGLNGVMEPLGRYLLAIFDPGGAAEAGELRETPRSEQEKKAATAASRGGR